MRSAAAFLLLALAACAQALEPLRDEEVLGYVKGFNNDDPRIEVPATVARGEAFTVAVTTYGGGCTSMGRTEVSRQGAEVVVTPIDRENRAAQVCTDILKSFRHVAPVQLHESGTARIVVRGRESPSGREIRVERTVVVR